MPSSDTYRFLAVDVDGTLVNTSQRVPEAHCEALHRAHHAGMTVCICTGRNVAETRAVIEAIGLDLDVGVFVFGSLISQLPEGKTIQRTTIPADTAADLVSYFNAQGFPVLALYDPQEMGVDYRFIEGPRDMGVFERWLEKAPATVERLSHWEPADCEPLRIGVIDEIDRSAETIRLLGQQFPKERLKFNSITAPNYGVHVVECFAPQVNKWYGIQHVASQLGIAASEIVAIGDDVNDLEMIQHAGLGIAMGNAIDEVKQLADWQAPSNDESGVAAAVDALLQGSIHDTPKPV
jgi:hypothetical protein